MDAYQDATEQAQTDADDDAGIMWDDDDAPSADDLAWFITYTYTWCHRCEGSGEETWGHTQDMWGTWDCNYGPCGACDATGEGLWARI